MPDEQPKRVLLCYAGDRLDEKKGGKRQYWLNVKGLPNEGEAFPDLFSAEGVERVCIYNNLYKFALAGDIFSFEEGSKEGSVMPSSVQREGRWMNGADLATWQALDMATNAELAARKKSKQDGLLCQLDDIREAYHRLGSLQRAQFLAKIVRHIVK